MSLHVALTEIDKEEAIFTLHLGALIHNTQAILISSLGRIIPFVILSSFWSTEGSNVTMDLEQ